jgi:excisionase family DNA binding protein
MPKRGARPPAPDTADLIARRHLWPMPEAAYQLGISLRTLWRRVELGELRTTKVGARTFITDAELRRFVANLEAAAG